jgi:hypothetical protein
VGPGAGLDDVEKRKFLTTWTRALCYKLEGRGFESRGGGFFSTDLILPADYGPGVDSASNRNEYQESSWGAKGGRRVWLTTLSSSVSRLSR